MKKSISLDKQQNTVVFQITAHYVEQVQSGEKPRLSDYLARYPDHKDAIVDFVAYYHAFEEPIAQRKESSLITDTLSEVSQLALEYVWQRVCLSGERWPHQVQTLLAKRDGQQLSPSYLATKLDLGIDLVMQLEQCEIDPESIPLALSRHLAQQLQYPLLAVQAYFTHNQYYANDHNGEGYQKVAEPPGIYMVPSKEGILAGKGISPVSFRQALRSSSQMTDQQKAFWNAIIERENA